MANAHKYKFMFLCTGHPVPRLLATVSDACLTQIQEEGVGAATISDYERLVATIIGLVLFG